MNSYFQKSAPIKLDVVSYKHVDSLITSTNLVY